MRVVWAAAGEKRGLGLDNFDGARGREMGNFGGVLWVMISRKYPSTDVIWVGFLSFQSKIWGRARNLASSGKFRVGGRETGSVGGKIPFEGFATRNKSKYV
jgi:hypothetical protein